MPTIRLCFLSVHLSLSFSLFMFGFLRSLFSSLLFECCLTVSIFSQLRVSKDQRYTFIISSDTLYYRTVRVKMRNNYCLLAYE